MKNRSPLESASMAIIEIAWRVIVICIAIYLTLIGITKAYSFGHGLLYEHGMEASPGTDVSFEISITDDRDSIGENLEKAGLLDNQAAFQLQSRLYKAVFEPGTYTLNTSMTLDEILSYLTEEGKKLSDLKEKNLVAETLESEADDPDVIGGNEDVQDAVPEGDSTEDASESASESMEILGGGDEG